MRHAYYGFERSFERNIELVSKLGTDIIVRAVRQQWTWHALLYHKR
jgi:hypothetical protein